MPDSLTNVDFIIVIATLVSAVFAFFRGFTREIMTIASWIGASLSSLYFFLPVKNYMRSIISSHMIADLLAGLSIFLSSMIVFSILIDRITRVVQGSAIGPIDRSLGLIFGVLRSLLLFAISYLAIVNFTSGNKLPEWMKQAKLLPMIQEVANITTNMLPEMVYEQLTTNGGIIMSVPILEEGFINSITDK